MIIDDIKRLAKETFSKTITDRRHLHKHPELSFFEHDTSAYVKSRFDEMGIPWKSMAGTGVVALIKGEKPSDQVVALRADLDALPITEANDVTYVSQNTGVMHACGHDAHTGSLLGTAGILQALKSQFGGTVKLIFQPGEEKLPGGASLMIKEGVLKDPAPVCVIGQHVMPDIECGKVGIRSGTFMASMDEIYATVKGQGGHGAFPHQNIDPVLIASHIIVALQQIVSRTSNPIVPTVLSFGKIIASGSVNIIPNEVYLEGTFRTLDENWRKEAHVQIKKMAAFIAESMGGSCDLRINPGYPVLINEKTLTDQVERHAREYLGESNVVNIDICMGAEDFAYYSQAADTCFYFLGAGNKANGIVSSLHTSTFNIDENALAQSTGLMAYLALKKLGN